MRALFWPGDCFVYMYIADASFGFNQIFLGRLSIIYITAIHNLQVQPPFQFSEKIWTCLS